MFWSRQHLFVTRCRTVDSLITATTRTTLSGGTGGSLRCPSVTLSFLRSCLDTFPVRKKAAIPFTLCATKIWSLVLARSWKAFTSSCLKLMIYRERMLLDVSTKLWRWGTRLLQFTRKKKQPANSTHTETSTLRPRWTEYKRIMLTSCTTSAT